MTTIRNIVYGVLLGMAAQPAASQVLISLDVQPPNISTLENVFIDINVSGLQSGGADVLLGGFELEFVYDSTVLNFLSASPAGFGDSLGNVFTNEARGFALPPLAGVFYLGVASRLESDEASCVFCVAPFLDGLQGNEFTLATVGLYAPSSASFEGLMQIEARNIVLSDSAGRVIEGVAGAQAFIALNDGDSDGIGNSIDNCTNVPNAAQTDSDGDGFGNICDADIFVPNDCQVNFSDLGTMKAAFFAQTSDPNWNPDADLNGDAVVNFQDLGAIKQLFFLPPGPSAVGIGCP